MKQSEEVKYRTEIAQLKATLYKLRFALPLKKAAEELVELCDDPRYRLSLISHSVDRALENLKEALENKRRYEDKNDV